MIPVMFAVLAVLSVICLILVANSEGRDKSLFLILTAIVALSNMGSLWLAISSTVEEALLANTLVYITGCFGQMLIFFIVCDLCKIKMPSVVKNVMAFFSTTVFLLACTVRYTDIYYKSYWMESYKGVTILKKEYGPIHNIYNILLVSYMIAIFAVVIYAIINKKFVSRKYLIALFVSQAVNVIAYMVQRAVIKTPIEYTPVFFTICIYIIAWVTNGVSKFDFAANVLRLKDEKESGYIFFDNDFALLAYDKTAAFYFPELVFHRVDEKLKDLKDPFLKELMDFVETSYTKKDYSKHIVRKLNKTDFVFTITPLKKKNGVCLLFKDDTDEQKYHKVIEDYNKNLRELVDEQTADIIQIKNKLVISMAAMVESRDNSTGGHIKRTSDVVAIFSKKLLEKKTEYNFSERFLSLVTKAAPMHDLGKIAVDDSILRKNGKFTDEEYEIMKRHSAEGARIVNEILRDVEEEEFTTIATNVAHYHHEKWNGMGYPMKLSKGEIPVEARIMALADVFDALVSKRCYKEAFSFDKAFSIIESELGDHFDPVLGKVFLECRQELIELYTGYPE